MMVLILCPLSSFGNSTFAGVPVAVQVESLNSFYFLCTELDENLNSQLLAEFPSLLVPLSSDNQVPEQLLYNFCDLSSLIKTFVTFIY